MRHFLTLVSAAALVLAWATAPARGAAITDDDVRRSIEKGREWLVNQQTAGQWPETAYWNGPGPCGNTELAAMTLLYTGSHPTNSAVMVQTLDGLLKRKLDYTYAVGCRTMAYAYALRGIQSASPRRDAVRQALDSRRPVARSGPAARRRLVLPSRRCRQQADRLLEHAVRHPRPLGGRQGRRRDSRCRLAADLEPVPGQPEAGWVMELSHPGGRRRRQHAWLRLHDGRRAGHHLHLCRHARHGERLPVRPGKSGGASRAELNRHIDLALGWLERNFDVSTNPLAVLHKAEHVLYWLYAVERVGIAAGYKYFGNHNWYKEGAARLIAQQNPDGSWAGGNPEAYRPGNAVGGGGDVGMHSNTCFAILFLYKGRAPILFNKLQETPGGEKWEWNPHRRDVANLTAYVEKNKEQLFQWQIVSLKATVEELHDAPILYISAESAPNFTADEKKKLREFTDTGGTILFEASCGNKAARDAFAKLAKEVWPEWAVKPLGPDHGSFMRPLPAEDAAARDPGHQRRRPDLRLLRHGRHLLPVADQGPGRQGIYLQVGHRPLHLRHRPQPAAGQTGRQGTGQVRPLRLGGAQAGPRAPWRSRDSRPTATGSPTATTRAWSGLPPRSRSARASASPRPTTGWTPRPWPARTPLT